MAWFEANEERHRVIDQFCPNCGMATSSTFTRVKDSGWIQAEFICPEGHGFSVSWPIGGHAREWESDEWEGA